MKATGIVRRIDDLGRIVIPKEIRRNLNIREGAPLEIYVDPDGELILKKYSPLKELTDLAQDYADSLWDKTRLPVLIVDYDGIVAAAGLEPVERQVRETPDVVRRYMDERRTDFVPAEEPVWEFASCVVAPIIAEGDPVGAVVVGGTADRSLGELELKLAATAAGFLARQLGS